MPRKLPATFATLGFLLALQSCSVYSGEMTSAGQQSVTPVGPGTLSPSSGPPATASQPTLALYRESRGFCFLYPSSWSPASEGTRGPDGFFMIVGGAEAPNIDSVTQAMAFHKLRPCGSRPSIRPLTVDGQEARLILPSEDQPGRDGESLLIVRQPGTPASPKGPAYPFLQVAADKQHIDAIVSSFRFEGTGDCRP